MSESNTRPRAYKIFEQGDRLPDYTRHLPTFAQDQQQFDGADDLDIRQIAISRISEQPPVSGDLYSIYEDPFDEFNYQYMPEDPDNIAAFRTVLTKGRVSSVIEERKKEIDKNLEKQKLLRQKQAVGNEEDCVFANLKFSLLHITDKFRKPLIRSKLFMDAVHYLNPKLMLPLELRPQISKIVLMQDFSMMGFEPLKIDTRVQSDNRKIAFKMFDDEFAIEGENTDEENIFSLTIISEQPLAKGDDVLLRIAKVEFRPEKYK